MRVWRGWPEEERKILIKEGYITQIKCYRSANRLSDDLTEYLIMTRTPGGEQWTSDTVEQERPDSSNHDVSPMARTVSLGDRPHVGVMSMNIALITGLRGGHSSGGGPTASANPLSK